MDVNERKRRLEFIDREIERYEEDLKMLRRHRSILVYGCHICGRDLSSTLDTVTSDVISGDIVYFHRECYEKHKPLLDIEKGLQSNGIQIITIEEERGE